MSADKFTDKLPRILIFSVGQQIEETSPAPISQFEVLGPRAITRLIWFEANKQLLASCDDGTVRRLDVETGEELQVVSVHDNKIQDMQMSVDGSHLITCSVDNYCKVLDSTDFSILKQYNTERQVNSAALHPYFFHVLTGGGQDAS